VQTVDFFTPIVDDPFTYGQIAAANGLSDVYAMGGRPITAMNLMGIPTDLVPPKIINSILRGGASKVKDARCALVGGHTIRNPEPIYGLSVTGVVAINRILTNANARAGDWLILTKPLGTGIATTAIKRGLASDRLIRDAVRSMKRLNTPGAILAEQRLVKAAVDVTGFGLLGHLGSMCRSSKVGAVLDARRLPLLGSEILDLIASGCVPGGSRENLEFARAFVEMDNVPESLQILAADAQTSGGLLLCVAPKHANRVQTLLKQERTLAASVIGRIVASPRPKILLTCKAHEALQDFPTGA
jgi:selenide,water dikinase